MSIYIYMYTHANLPFSLLCMYTYRYILTFVGIYLSIYIFNQTLTAGTAVGAIPAVACQGMYIYRDALDGIFLVKGILWKVSVCRKRLKTSKRAAVVVWFLGAR